MGAGLSHFPTGGPTPTEGWSRSPLRAHRPHACPRHIPPPRTRPHPPNDQQILPARWSATPISADPRRTRVAPTLARHVPAEGALPANNGIPAVVAAKGIFQLAGDSDGGFRESRSPMISLVPNGDTSSSQFDGTQNGARTRAQGTRRPSPARVRVQVPRLRKARGRRSDGDVFDPGIDLRPAGRMPRFWKPYVRLLPASLSARSPGASQPPLPTKALRRRSARAPGQAGPLPHRGGRTQG